MYVVQARLLFQVMALNGTRTTHGEQWHLHNLELIKVPLLNGEEVDMDEVTDACEVRQQMVENG